MIAGLRWLGEAPRGVHLALGPRSAEAASLRGLIEEAGLDPESLETGRDDLGRLVLSRAGQPLAASRSRAGGWCLQALALEGRLGVDLVAPGLPEALICDALPPPEQSLIWQEGLHHAASAWAAREALLKALGLTLAWGPDLRLGWADGTWAPGTFQGRPMEGWELSLGRVGDLWVAVARG